VVNATITSRLDLNNSLLMGLPTSQINRLQRVQNQAARLVVKIPRSVPSSITQIRKDLHWLPVTQRINFKILTIVYKCLFCDNTPSYLRNMLHLRSSSRDLRSSQDPILLDIPSTKKRLVIGHSHHLPPGYGILSL
jgi:hypothetical protein